MPFHMLGHEGRDEVVRVVVARLQADRGVDAGGLAGFGEAVGAELFDEELVGGALVDQQVIVARAILDQHDGVVFAP